MKKLLLIIMLPLACTPKLTPTTAPATAPGKVVVTSTPLETQVGAINSSVVTLNSKLITVSTMSLQAFVRSDSLIAQQARADGRLNVLETQNAWLLSQVNALSGAIALQQQNQVATTSALIAAGRKVRLTGMPGEVYISKISDSSYVIGLVKEGQSVIPNSAHKKQK